MTVTIRDLLRSQTSYDWAVRYLHEGRITQKTFEHFCFFHDWAAFRFSGGAAIRQARFYDRLGQAALCRRIDRVKRIHDRLIADTVS